MKSNDELRRLQTRHQLILDSAGEGVYGLDTDGNTTFANAAATRILGWHGEDVIGQTARGIYAARLSAGQADPASGRFRFTVAEGSLIEEGKLTRPLDGAVISGTGPAALAAVDLVGTDAAVDPTAAGCTKGEQTLPVSVGHPTLRLRSLMVEPLHDAGEGRP